MMLNKTLKIINKLGLHARASSKLVELASRYESNIFIIKDGIRANAKSLMSIMMLAASCGSMITITAEGVDEDLALQGLTNLIETKFGEEG